MAQILLIRTGKTDYDQQRRVQGTINLPLCEEGERDIRRIADQLAKLEIDALYAGPEPATQQTAEIVSNRIHRKVKTRKQLHNLDLGLWQGMLVEEVKQKQPRVYRQWLEHPETVCPPEGETVKEALGRLRETVDKLLKKHKGETIALVLPEPLASLFCHQFTNCCMGDLWHACPEDRPAWEMMPAPAALTLSETNGLPVSHQELA